MTVIPTREPVTVNRVAAGSLAMLGAASAIPLAQLDFAGVINAFNIDSGDSPRALLIIAGVGGVLTILILALAFAGAILALIGAPPAQHVLIAAALAGLVTAMPLWIPAGVVIGAAAVMLGQPRTPNPTEHSSRNLQPIPGVTTRTCRNGED
jgi:hypothetical protein